MRTKRQTAADDALATECSNWGELIENNLRSAQESIATLDVNEPANVKAGWLVVAQALRQGAEALRNMAPRT